MSETLESSETNIDPVLNQIDALSWDRRLRSARRAWKKLLITWCPQVIGSYSKACFSWGNKLASFNESLQLSTRRVLIKLLCRFPSERTHSTFKTKLPWHLRLNLSLCPSLPPSLLTPCIKSGWRTHRAKRDMSWQEAHSMHRERWPAGSVRRAKNDPFESWSR